MAVAHLLAWEDDHPVPGLDMPNPLGHAENNHASTHLAKTLGVSCHPSSQHGRLLLLGGEDAGAGVDTERELAGLIAVEFVALRRVEIDRVLATTAARREIGYASRPYEPLIHRVMDMLAGVFRGLHAGVWRPDGFRAPEGWRAHVPNVELVRIAGDADYF